MIYYYHADEYRNYSIVPGNYYTAKGSSGTTFLSWNVERIYILLCEKKRNGEKKKNYFNSQLFYTIIYADSHHARPQYV